MPTPVSTGMKPPTAAAGCAPCTASATPWTAAAAVAFAFRAGVTPSWQSPLRERPTFGDQAVFEDSLEMPLEFTASYGVLSFSPTGSVCIFFFHQSPTSTP
eukprot:EG_transcript_32318